MRTIRVTPDDDLVKAIDRVTEQLKTTHSACTRKALQEELDRIHLEQLERRHREGYEKHPVGIEEFSVWEDNMRKYDTPIMAERDQPKDNQIREELDSPEIHHERLLR